MIRKPKREEDDCKNAPPPAAFVLTCLALLFLAGLPNSASAQRAHPDGSTQPGSACYGVFSAVNLTNNSGWTSSTSVTGSAYATDGSGDYIMGGGTSISTPSFSYSNVIKVYFFNNSGFTDSNSFSTSVVADGYVPSETVSNDKAQSSTYFDNVVASGSLPNSVTPSLTYNQSKKVTDDVQSTDDGDYQELDGLSSGMASAAYVTP